MVESETTVTTPPPCGRRTAVGRPRARSRTSAPSPPHLDPTPAPLPPRFRTSAPLPEPPPALPRRRVPRYLPAASRLPGAHFPAFRKRDSGVCWAKWSLHWSPLAGFSENTHRKSRTMPDG
ncbi:hypothetical protein GCM10009548_79570 [Streptomyces malaysiensis subsp. malaysiensis]